MIEEAYRGAPNLDFEMHPSATYPGLEIHLPIQLTLEPPGFELPGSIYMWILFFKIQLALHYPWASHPQIQTTLDQKQYFGSMVGNLQMQRVHYMHCSAPFYVGT